MSIDDPQHGSTERLANPHLNAVAAAPVNPNPNYNQRMLPRQMSSGALRGTQNVGYGDVKIDGSNNQISVGSITNSLGSQEATVIGQLSDNPAADPSFGLKVVDNNGAQLLIGVLPDGNLGFEIIDADGNEVMRAGFLPITGIYGWAAATPGNSLEGQV